MHYPSMTRAKLSESSHSRRLLLSHPVCRGFVWCTVLRRMPLLTQPQLSAVGLAFPLRGTCKAAWVQFNVMPRTNSGSGQVLGNHRLSIEWYQLRLLAVIPSRRRLRSASSPALAVPVTRRRTIGDRAFPVAAARVWNSLPPEVTTAPSLAAFRRRLKSELFERSYGGSR